jgi:hypothetical protein
MTALDLSADIGLVAVGLATLNLLVGSLIAMRYSPWRYWPHHRFNIFRVHNWTGYLLLVTCVAHPTVLLFSSTARFRIRDILYPVHSPSQPLENTIGAIALYCLLSWWLHPISGCAWGGDSGSHSTSSSMRPPWRCFGTASSPIPI